MSAELGQPTILIVDDDEMTVEMLDLLLTGQRYRTRKAYSGQEVLALIEREAPQATGWRPWTVDLVLLDIMMPGVDGYKICLRIKDDPALRHIPVIMVTVLDSCRDRITAMSFGADGYVTKPWVSEELVSLIQARLRIKAQQEALLRRQVELETIRRTAASAYRSVSLSVLVNSGLATLLECGHVEGVAIYTVDETPQSLTLAEAQGPEGVALPTPLSCGLGEGVLGRIARSQRGQWFDDMAGHPDFADRPASPMCAYVGAPLCDDDRTMGVLEVFHRQPGWFDGRDVAWLDELGQCVGCAMGNAGRFERARTALFRPPREHLNGL